MAQYDPAILQQFADALYRKALTIVIASTLLGLVIGLVLGGVVAQMVVQEMQNRDASLPAWAITVLLTGYIGFAIGQARAFFYRLQAQLALCQKQIEANTRDRALHNPPLERTAAAV